MALRVTQSHVAVLADQPAGFDGTGLLRVTQSHVSVLGDEPAGFDGTGVLRATQVHGVVVAGEPAGFDGTGLLRATQMHGVVVAGEPAGFDGLGVMRVTQVHLSILGGYPAEAVSDDIELNESIVTAMGYNRAISDTIALTENAASVTVEGDDIDLDESISLSHGRHVFDTMSLDEDMDLGISVSVSDTIAVGDEARRVLHVNDDIDMDDVALKIHTAIDTISLTEILFNSDHVYVTDTISLTDAVQQEPTPSDSIQLFETVDYNWSGDRDADDDIGLYETISYVVNSDCPTCCDPDEDYRPYVGVTSDPTLPTPPSIIPPTLTQSHSVVLSWPVVTPSLTVTLRAPDFGNRDQVSNNRIHRESRGGTLIIYSDPQWPKIRRLVMEFSVLSETVAQEYLAFRSATLGKQIKFVDHESHEWVGVLTATDTPIVRNRRQGITASLTFEGELA